jgi:hypothetical protein
MENEHLEDQKGDGRSSLLLLLLLLLLYAAEGMRM